MRIRILLWSMVFLLLVSSCTRRDDGDNQTLATVGGYKLKVSEFQRLLATEMEYDQDLKLTTEGKAHFLEELIRKELLIQIAKKRKLDQEQKFIHTIERYWEATLIRNLMALEGEKISTRIVISQEEIESRYNELKTEDESLPPLAVIEKDISTELKEEKKTKFFKAWIDDLRLKADISINNHLLDTL